MIWFLLGTATLFLLMWLLRAFSRASITEIKTFLCWAGAIAGVSLALLLIVTGRGGFGLFALSFLAPLIWDRWLGPFLNKRGTRPTGEQPRHTSGGMSRDEAYQVLGLKPGATREEIRAAHRRLMATAHPDRGGSDWIAARLNQARDALLG